MQPALHWDAVDTGLCSVTVTMESHGGDEGIGDRYMEQLCTVSSLIRDETVNKKIFAKQHNILKHTIYWALSHNTLSGL